MQNQEKTTVNQPKIFADLAAIDVSKHVEKKGNLSYLSWTYALDQLLRNDPMATWTFKDPKLFGRTMMVFSEVTAFGKTLGMHLPVMDNRNNSVLDPDSRKVSDAMMRCLTKNIACFGIGLYIYAGEDLPPADDDNSQNTNARENQRPPAGNQNSQSRGSSQAPTGSAAKKPPIQSKSAAVPPRSVNPPQGPMEMEPPAGPRTPGEYVITFGKKWNGRALGSMTHEEIRGYWDWLERKAKHDGKEIDPNGPVGEFIFNARQIVGELYTDDQG